MAETCAINFLTTDSYSTFIVLGGLRGLLLAVLMGAGPDLENFAENQQSAVLAYFSMIHHQHNLKFARRLCVVTKRSFSAT